MTYNDFGDDPYWTGLEDYEPEPVHDRVAARTVRGAPPGEVRNASPREIRVGDWLVLAGTAYEITNMFSPGFDRSVKRVILRGRPDLVVKTRQEIVRPYEVSHRARRRPW
ncbi:MULTISPECIES: hypothetical protein [Streptomyces]|uniref:hypothetical protein n=1 Tax=Streptomyces TaxID=1883 RepID=UPI0006AFC3CD|nr:hypothetical protein [Streptomyces sp. XY511]KOU98399.1 hypothetical protein ADK91_30290 [Streptomyces sp. XY511]